MTVFIQRCAAVAFYILGTSFFLSFVFLVNGVRVLWCQWWMEIADLPLLFSGMIFGGISLYRSVKKPETESIILACTIGIPLTSLFIFFVMLNFWVQLGLPVGEVL